MKTYSTDTQHTISIPPVLATLNESQVIPEHLLGNVLCAIITPHLTLRYAIHVATVAYARYDQLQDISDISQINLEIYLNYIRALAVLDIINQNFKTTDQAAEYAISLFTAISEADRRFAKVDTSDKSALKECYESIVTEFDQRMSTTIEFFLRRTTYED